MTKVSTSNAAGVLCVACVTNGWERNVENITKHFSSIVQERKYVSINLQYQINLM